MCDEKKHKPANFEDVFFLQLLPDDCLHIVLEVIEYAVKCILVSYDLFYCSDLFHLRMSHQGYVFIFKYLVPASLFL
jgi:hypothetical protein